MQYDLGCFDEEADRVERAENPFRAEVLSYVGGIIRYLSARNGPLIYWSGVTRFALFLRSRYGFASDRQTQVVKQPNRSSGRG